MKHIQFTPIYQERVWGGTDLKTKLGRDIPDGKVIGESWEIVDRPEAQSISSDGATLRELISADPEGIMGTGWSAERPFPILVKWLDCQERLSLQVHPPADLAASLNVRPKTEVWYVAEAKPHATLIAGLKSGVTREDFEKGLKKNDLESLVHSIPVQTGESIFIPSGRIHAIGGGNLILEVQQNSDTTYRVYDWGRVGLNGKPRELHIEASLMSSDFNDFKPSTIKPTEGDQVLATSDVFNLRKVSLKVNQTLAFEHGSPRILSVVSGSLEEDDGSTIQRSENVLLPAKYNFNYTCKADAIVLITEDFLK